MALEVTYINPLIKGICMKIFTPAILLAFAVLTGCTMPLKSEVKEVTMETEYNRYLHLDYVISRFTFQLCIDSSHLGKDELVTLANDALAVNYSKRRVARTTYITHMKVDPATGKYVPVGVCVDVHAKSKLLGYVAYKDIAIHTIRTMYAKTPEYYSIRVNRRVIFGSDNSTDIVKLLEERPRDIFKLGDRNRYMNGK